MLVATLLTPVTRARGELRRRVPTRAESLLILRSSERTSFVCAGVLLLLLLLVLLGSSVAIVVAGGLRGVVGVLFGFRSGSGELLDEEPGREVSLSCSRHVRVDFDAHVLWLNGGDSLQAATSGIRALLIGSRRFVQLGFLRGGALGSICRRCAVLLLGDRRSRWFCLRRLRLSVGRVHCRSHCFCTGNKRPESIGVNGNESEGKGPCRVRGLAATDLPPKISRRSRTKAERGRSLHALHCRGGGVSVWRTKAVKGGRVGGGAERLHVDL